MNLPTDATPEEIGRYLEILAMTLDEVAEEAAQLLDHVAEGREANALGHFGLALEQSRGTLAALRREMGLDIASR